MGYSKHVINYIPKNSSQVQRRLSAIYIDDDNCEWHTSLKYEFTADAADVYFDFHGDKLRRHM